MSFFDYKAGLGATKYCESIKTFNPQRNAHSANQVGLKEEMSQLHMESYHWGTTHAQ